MRKVSFLFVLLLTLIPSLSAAQEIDFLIQGDTYTPAFYRGRPLWSSQSRVIIQAIPRIPGANASTLFYRWSKNGTVLGGDQGVNGIGRDALAFTDATFGKPQEIRLEILSSEDEVLASKAITISPVSPSVLVYEDNPSYGLLFNREVGSEVSLRQDEVTFASIPLNFSVASRVDPVARYSWRTNTGGVDQKNSVTYRAPEGIKGSSQVTASVSHPDKLLQSARKSFLVNFGL